MEHRERGAEAWITIGTQKSLRAENRNVNDTSPPSLSYRSGGQFVGCSGFQLDGDGLQLVLKDSELPERVQIYLSVRTPFR